MAFSPGAYDPRAFITPDWEWRGPWDSTLSYQPFQAVFYAGTAWVAVDDSLGVVPGSDGGTLWFALTLGWMIGAQAIPGVDGQDGQDGYDIPGPQGPAGATGSTGAPGSTGSTGPTGAIGPMGFFGPPGLDGIDGYDAYPIPGPIGPTGAAGPSGLNAPPAYDGQDGTEGWEIPGPAGVQGPQGAAGTNGTNGSTGPTGPAGTTGLASRTTAVAIANTETMVLNTSIAANTINNGTTYRIRAKGALTTGATPGNSIIQCRFGPTTLTGNIPITVTIANSSVIGAAFDIDFLITVRTNGASGTVIGALTILAPTAFNLTVSVTAPTATVVIDTTAINLLEFTYKSGNAGSTATFTVAEIELVKA